MSNPSHSSLDQTRAASTHASSNSPTGIINRRTMLGTLGAGVGALGLFNLASAADSKETTIQGFDETSKRDTKKTWSPISDRKVRVGLVGYGTCHFSAVFGFQDHPNVEIAAVSDLIPERCAALAKRVNCNKTYPSLEEMVNDDSIEALYVATDAPSHARLCALALSRGKHVASAVPAIYGSLEDAHMLFEAVKKSGQKYMMFETSAFREDLHAMRVLYQAGFLGEVVYSEGEYIHYMPDPIASYKGWRDGSIPMWYPTHATAYPLAVTGGSFTEVSCLGMPSALPSLNGGKNRYNNAFGTEVGLFRASNGGMARILTSKDTPGFGAEAGRIRGTKGSFSGTFGTSEKKGKAKITLPDVSRPALPPSMDLGGHGGSHAYLTNEFISAILQNRKPLVDIAMALNLTVSGIVAHQSALKGGETMKIPQFHL